MPTCYQLIGVPGSGKTTWAINQKYMLTCAYVSTDKWVDIYAKEVGKTYNEIFEDFMSTAVDLMTREVVVAREMQRNIIWDQTSTTIKSRLKKFNMLPNYDHIAVVFKIPSIEDLTERLASRPGKMIPWSVVRQMIDNFEMPTKAEGYKEIWYA